VAGKGVQTFLENSPVWTTYRWRDFGKDVTKEDKVL